MKRVHLVCLSAALAIGLVVVAFFGGDGERQQLIAYVACADRKVYGLDLEHGELLRISDSIENIGTPSTLDYYSSRALLYIGSERARMQNDYYPLVAVDVSADFSVERRFTLDPSRETIDISVANDARAVYGVVISERSERIFVAHTVPNGSGVTTILDAATGDFIGESSVLIIRSTGFLSPDGLQFAYVWPSGVREREGAVVEWSGGVAVKDIATGATVSSVELDNNRGLEPPWGASSSEFVYLSRPDNLLQVYDRESGQVISSIDIQELTDMLLSSVDLLHIANTSRVALSMITMPSDDGSHEGFVVIVDYATGRVVHTLEVGPNPTNIVLAQS